MWSVVSGEFRVREREEIVLILCMICVVLSF